MTIAEGNAPVPENIRRVIEQKRLTQREIADQTGFSAQQFSDMLNGRKIIKPCDLSRISAALGVDVSELFVKCKPSARSNSA